MKRLAVVLVLASLTLPTIGHTATTRVLYGTVSRLMGDAPEFTRMIDKGLRLDTGDTIYKLRGASDRFAGSTVRVEGRVEGDTVIVEQITELAKAPLAPPAQTTLAVILLNFADNRAQPWTPAAVRATAFTAPYSIDGEYAFSSDQSFRVTGEVFGWYPITQTSTGCNFSSWSSEARTMAINAGVNLAGYERVQYAWPYASGCGFAGLGQMPGSTSWINGSYGNPTAPVHEFGHNLGLHHASSYRCTQAGVPVVYSDSCIHGEYGDSWAMMGVGDLLSNWARAVLGWITPTVVTTTGTYLLAPATTPNASNRLLSIPRNNGTLLHLEYRQPSQPFANYGPDWPAVTGVQVRMARDPANGIGQVSHLLDMTPGTATFWDAPLAAGLSWTDNLGSGSAGVKITTLSTGPMGAQVRIEFAGPPPTTTTVAPTTTTSSTTTTSTTTTTTTTLPPPPGTIALVRNLGGVSRSGQGNAQTVLTITAPVGIGHRVIVTASVGTFAGDVICTDSRGNVYALDGRSANRQLAVCSAPMTAGLFAGDTITVRYPGFSGTSTVVASEFSGVLGLDGPARLGASTSTRTVSGNPPLTTSGKALVVGAISGNGFVPAVGFSAAGILGSTFTEYRAFSVAATVSTLGTVSSGAWRAVLVAYRGS